MELHPTLQHPLAQLARVTNTGCHQRHLQDQSANGQHPAAMAHGHREPAVCHSLGLVHLRVVQKETTVPGPKRFATNQRTALGAQPAVEQQQHTVGQTECQAQRNQQSQGRIYRKIPQHLFGIH